MLFLHEIAFGSKKKEKALKTDFMACWTRHTALNTTEKPRNHAAHSQMQTTRRNVSLQTQPERSKQPSCKAFYGDKSSIRKRIILHLKADIF